MTDTLPKPAKWAVWVKRYESEWRTGTGLGVIVDGVPVGLEAEESVGFVDEDDWECVVVSGTRKGALVLFDKWLLKEIKNP